MPQVTPEIQDRTEELSFASASSECCETLLETGIVLVKGVVDEDGVVGMEIAARRRFYTTLHKRLLAKTLKKMPLGGLRPRVEVFHSRTAQFDPREVPFLLRSTQRSIDAMSYLYDEFFAHGALREMYGGKPPLNNVNVAHHGPFAPPFDAHQDSLGLTGLGEILQAKPSRYHIHAWEGSRNDSDFTFDTERGDVTVLLERVGAPPDDLPPASGNYPEYWEANGSEIHSGINLSGEVRYRQALFAQQKAETI